MDGSDGWRGRGTLGGYCREAVIFGHWHLARFIITLDQQEVSLMTGFLVWERLLMPPQGWDIHSFCPAGEQYPDFLLGLLGVWRSSQAHLA